MAGYEDRYLISNDGLVLNSRWNRLKKPQIAHNGYLRIGLSMDGQVQKVTIHRLVAEAFIGLQPTPQHQINHKDEDQTNSYLYIGEMEKLDDVSWNRYSEEFFEK